MKSLLKKINPASRVLGTARSGCANRAGDILVALLSAAGPCRRPGWMLIVLGLLISWRAEAGTWSPLAHAAPGSVQLMLLLSDGTVMAASAGANGWYRLTPDIHGSYVNGTWSSLADMHDTRLYYSSDVLRDGRVFVAGGEYGTGSTNAEVYDPLNDTWTMAPPSGQRFSDSISEILPDGNVLVSPVGPSTSGGTVIFNAVSNTWSAGGHLYRGYYQDEASWVKLPDNSILTIDPFGQNSERYIPSLNQWVNDSTVPVSLYDIYLGELGAGFLLPDGRAFFLGSSGHTAFYTPTGNTNPGSWAAGPDIPNGQGTPDAPAAMMVNGKILCAVSPVPYANGVYPSPTSFYEFDPVANSFTQVNGPTGLTAGYASYVGVMLDLPDGTVLYSSFSSQLYDYQPGGVPLASGRPTIASIITNMDGSFHLTGTLLNGISEGAAYGDDNQMSGNYPIVRLSDSGGNVFYARTFNWSSTGVMTGNTPVTTEFSLPPNLLAGTYQLVVVANGISSDPVLFSTGTIHAKAGDSPIAVTGYNRDLIVENTAAGGNTAPYVSQAFDALNNFGFYQAGLNAASISGGNGTTEGLPLNRTFTNALDGVTTFQLGPYTGNNAVYLSQTSPLGGFTLVTPQRYSSLSILASSANGGGSGSVVIHFAGGSSSPAIGFNAQDWFNNSGAALTHFGRIYLGNFGVFQTDDPSGNYPNLYQTTINLNALGLNTNPVTSLTFTRPTGVDISSNTDTAVFALSGTLSPFPLITSQPQSLAVPVGSNALFSVAVVGLAPFSYQWQLNGTNLTDNSHITGSQTNGLTITGTSTNDAGPYQLVLANAYGSVTSMVATLSVGFTPGIAQPPTNTIVPQGNTATFQVIASGSPTFNYQWLSYGTNLADNGRISGSQGNVLSIAGVLSNDAGNYQVLVANLYGSITSAVASLTIDPLILQQPASAAVALTSNVTFTVAATGTLPLAYQWLFNGATLADSGRISGSQSNMLTIAGLLSGDAGSYQAVITGTSGSATSAVATLVVGVRPSFTLQPVSKAVAQGTNTSFVAFAGGSTPIGYQWLFNGTLMPGRTASLLSLSNVQLTNVGAYQAVATNYIGAATSLVATITISGPPQIISQPTNQLVMPGSTASFQASATGTAPLAYQWQVAGTNLADTGRISGSLTNLLAITGVVTNDAGYYQLIITNSSGSVTSTPAALTLLLPPLFQNVMVTNGILAFSWSAVTGQTYQVQYNSNLTQTNWLDLSTVITATNVTMTGSDTSPATNSQRFYRVILLQ